MRTSPVLFAIVAAAVGAVYGCSLPLEGLSASADSGGAGGVGGAGGERSVTSAGGALSTTTGTTTSASTSTSAACTQDSDCSGGSECNAPKCTNGDCGFETASRNGALCGPTPGPCFDQSQCADGECVARPKPPSTVIEDGTPGNCTSLVCDGTGNSKPGADIADLPKDGDTSDCNEPTCNGTMAGTKARSDGADCGFLMHCLAGQCRQCASDSRCLDDLSVCTARFCNKGTCGQKPANEGGYCGLGGKCKDGKCH